MLRAKLFMPAIVAALMLASCGEGAAPAGGPSLAAQPSGGPNETDVKAVIERRVLSLATGVGSSHSSVAVTFEDITFGEARPLNAQDKIDGLRGDAVYPVRARYSELRTWGNGQTESVSTHYAYDFYKDEFGAWNFNAKGPVQ